MSDFTPVWKELTTSHVLLLVDTHKDPSKPGSGYDMVFFDYKVEELYEWFQKIVKNRCGKTDFLMTNGAWLCIRPLVPAPAFPSRPNLKIMVLR